MPHPLDPGAASRNTGFFILIMKTFFCLLLLALAAPAQESPQPSYVYRAELVRVIDGDTVVMHIDLGFGVWMHNQSLRLLDVEAPEVRGPEKEDGLRWAAKLRALLADRSEIVVQTVKDKKEKYGRYLAVVWADGLNLNEEMKKGLP